MAVPMINTYLKNVSHGVFAVDLLLHDTILVDTDCRQDIQDGLVHGFKTVDNEGDGDPLPTWDALLCAPPPVLGLLRLADVTDIQPVTIT